MRTARQELIELHLTSGTDPKIAEALRPVIDRSLTMLAQALTDREASAGDLTQQIERFRTDFAAAAEPAAVQSIAESCFAVCEDALRKLQSDQTEKRAEVVRLVALVRDAVGMLAGEGDSFSTSLNQTADRFDSLLEITNLQQLKSRLVSEVRSLRQLAVERQKKFREQMSVFQQRVSSLESQLAAAKQEAGRDHLTGVSNRRHFEEMFTDFMKAGNRQFILATFDIDNFKTINDTAGHAAGDRVLENVAKTLRAAFRGDDVIARIGGDEFVVLAAGFTLVQAEARLRTVLGSLTKIGSCLREAPFISMSCGIAEFSAGDTIQSLMQRSDMALLDAKRQGKNRVVSKATPFLRDLRRR